MSLTHERAERKEDSGSIYIVIEGKSIAAGKGGGGW
jgi:hypothetical protein